jgi:hypothetical protein
MAASRAIKIINLILGLFSCSLVNIVLLCISMESALWHSNRNLSG